MFPNLVHLSLKEHHQIEFLSPFVIHTMPQSLRVLELHRFNVSRQFLTSISTSQLTRLCLSGLSDYALQVLALYVQHSKSVKHIVLTKKLRNVCQMVTLPGITALICFSKGKRLDLEINIGFDECLQNRRCTDMCCEKHPCAKDKEEICRQLIEKEVNDLVTMYKSNNRDGTIFVDAQLHLKKVVVFTHSPEWRELNVRTVDHREQCSIAHQRTSDEDACLTED